MDLEYLWTNGTDSDPGDTKLGMQIPYMAIICLATFTGTIGNLMVIGAVLVNKKLRKVGNIFIVNLAIADLCVTAIVDPFSIIGIVLGRSWFVGRHGVCEFIASLCLTSCFCSLLSIGAISFNRFIHICHNHHYDRVYTVRNSVLMCFGLWITSFLLEFPNFIGWGDHVYDRKTLSCVWDRTADLSYTIVFSTVGVAFPVILISICYLKIYLFVLKQKKKMNAMRELQQRDSRESMRLARTLFIIFVIFTVCWLPYAIVVVADVDDTFPQELHIFSILIAHTNSSLNSILYGLADVNFRDGYKRLLGLDRCLEKRGIHPLDTSLNTELNKNSSEKDQGLAVIAVKRMATSEISAHGNDKISTT